MKIARVVQYSDIYPEQIAPNVNNLIQSINREHLCTVTSNMFNRLVEQPFFNIDLDPSRGEFDYIRFFLSGNSAVFLQDAVKRFRTFQNNEPNQTELDVEYVATTKAAVMSFQRLFFSLMPSVDMISVQMEQDFFKALLLINQQVYEFQYDDKLHEVDPPDLKLANFLLANKFANEDVDASDLNDAFRRQLVKSVELFTFLCRNKRLKPVRERFYAHFHIGNWIEYIISHIACIHWMKHKSGLLSVGGKHITGRKVRRVLKRSCIDSLDVIPYNGNIDYIHFRSKPFIHLGKHRYAITNISFVAEHIYNSVYFELKKYRAYSGFNSDDVFREYFTTEFSQKYMFHRFVRRCMRGDEIVVLDGEQCDKIVEIKKVQRINPLDFYARYTNCCVLFEFKDTLLSAKLKDERDSEKFFKEIKNKFVEKPDGTPKGIGQLMKNVKAIKDGTFIFDNLAPDIMVYPVLVVDNPVYTMSGMRTKLEYLMREYCKEKGIEDINVRPLILVDVASFRLYSDYLSSVSLPRAFEDYYREIHIPVNPQQSDIIRSTMSFSDYLKQHPVSNLGKVFNQIVKQATPYIKD